MKIANVQYYSTHQKSILSNIVTESDINDNYSYTSCINCEIEKTPETHSKKLEFNINKPEIGLKKIDFNIIVNKNEIDDMNKDEIDHSSDDIVDDMGSNIKDHNILEKQTNHNSLCTLANIKLQLSYHLEELNKANDWKNTNSHEGELLIDSNSNAGNNALHPRIFYVLYIGSNDNSNGHLIYKLSTD